MTGGYDIDRHSIPDEVLDGLLDGRVRAPEPGVADDPLVRFLVTARRHRFAPAPRPDDALHALFATSPAATKPATAATSSAVASSKPAATKPATAATSSAVASSAVVGRSSRVVSEGRPSTPLSRPRIEPPARSGPVSTPSAREVGGPGMAPAAPLVDTRPARTSAPLFDTRPAPTSAPPAFGPPLFGPQPEPRPTAHSSVVDAPPATVPNPFPVGPVLDPSPHTTVPTVARTISFDGEADGPMRVHPGAWAFEKLPPPSYRGGVGSAIVDVVRPTPSRVLVASALVVTIVVAGLMWFRDDRQPIAGSEPTVPTTSTDSVPSTEAPVTTDPAGPTTSPTAATVSTTTTTTTAPTTAADPAPTDPPTTTTETAPTTEETTTTLATTTSESTTSVSQPAPTVTVPSSTTAPTSSTSSSSTPSSSSTTSTVGSSTTSTSTSSTSSTPSSTPDQG